MTKTRTLCKKAFATRVLILLLALPHAQPAMDRVCLALKLITSILKNSFKERKAWNDFVSVGERSVHSSH